MASKKHGGHEGGSGIHELPSGLMHTDDSDAGGQRGNFVQYFGEPGDPTVKEAPSHDNGYLGKMPQLSRRFMARKEK